MQQTDKYKFNLVETGDVFSPDPLNENMEKVEAQFEAVRAETAAGDAAEAAARAQACAALDQRLRVFEARHMAYGTYRPQAEGTNIKLGFRPAIVLIMTYATFLSGALTDGGETSNGAVTADGFWIAPTTSNGTINHGGYTFAYVAFG